MYLEALGNAPAETAEPAASTAPASSEPTSSEATSSEPASSEPTSSESAESPAAPITPRTANELRGDTRLLNLLRGAVDAVADEQGWALLSAVGNQIANRASFDSRNYGYRKLSDLIAATGLFEVKRAGKASAVRALPRKGARDET
ncbi:OST-HTH/LOTUS domain-containing protein [Stenotrophomonas terrae]